MKRRPLPPLGSLVAFEAAARRLSFTAAAAELHITQSAVSHQIRHLEEYLGRLLFIRTKHGITLTSLGLNYYQGVHSSLNQLTAKTSELLDWEGNRDVTVATTDALASMWLLPRLSRFRSEHGEINVHVLTANRLQDIRYSKFDLALYYYRTPPTDVIATPLFHEEVFPVCSAEYLAQHGPITEPQQLFGHTLLCLEDGPSDWVTWLEWFQRMGVSCVKEPRHTLTSNNYSILVQGALAGDGVALAWRNITDPYLNKGLLACPITASFKSNAYFYLVEPQERLHRSSGALLFRDWLISNESTFAQGEKNMPEENLNTPA